MSGGLRRSSRLPQAHGHPGAAGSPDIIPNLLAVYSTARQLTSPQPDGAGRRFNYQLAENRARHRAGPFAQAGASCSQRWKLAGQERESSESPMLNAFCRVAPSVLFNFLAILAAGVFLRAMVFSSRTSVEVHARRFFDFLGINPPYQIGSWYPLAGAEEIGTDRISIMNS
jgi:hypothetical protein